MRFSLGTGTVFVMSTMAMTLAGSAAYAQIPQDGVITACYARSTGAIRVIDPAVASCRTGETMLTWNQQGRDGRPGPEGPAGPAGADGADGAPGTPGESGPSVDLVAGKVTLTTACGGFCSGFRFRVEGYTSPADSQDQDAVELPFWPGATMSELTFTLSSTPPAGHTFQVGFTDGETFMYCQITTGTSCSPAGTATFNGAVYGFIDTSYAENTGRRVSFRWKRTF